MNLIRLSVANVPQGVGIKVKRGQQEILFFRYNHEWVLWEELIFGGTFTFSDIVQGLAIEQGIGSSILIFQCSCALCKNAPRSEAGKKFAAQVESFVSHGWWPECATLERERLESEIETANAISE